MHLSETRKGELYVLGEALLWGIFPVITILSYVSLHPLATLAWSTLFAGVFFGLAMVVRGKSKELLTKGIWRQVLLIAFFIGWLFYGFYFLGLKFTTAGNASIIALMELFFSYLLFNVWKKEAFSPRQSWGAILMLVGALIILVPKTGYSLHSGDWLVLAGTACAPLGNFYQQKLRKVISSETMLFLRSLLTFPFIFLLAYFLKIPAAWRDVSGFFWLLLLNGFVALGLSKLWWLESIHRISVTKANALAVVAPMFTLLYAFLLLHQGPTIWQLLSFIPLAGGLILLTYEKSPA